MRECQMKLKSLHVQKMARDGEHKNLQTKFQNFGAINEKAPSGGT